MQRRQEISRALAVVLLLIGSLLVATPAKAKTNTVILYGSEWLGGGGVDIYSNDGNYGSAIGDYFKIPVNGVEYRTGLRWQCVEMVYRLYLARGWISLPTNPNTFSWSVPHSAREMYDTAPSHLNKSPNGAIEAIGPGDVVVLNGGSFLDDLGVPAGHVAIVESVSGSTVTTVNQNLNGTNARRTFTWNQSAKTLNSGWAGYGTIGIVHAPGSTSNRSQPFIGTPADGNVVENITPGAGGHYYVAAGGVLFWFDKNDPNLRSAFIAEMQRRYGTDQPLKMHQSNIHPIEANWPTPHAHRPNNNTFLYERGSQTQFVVMYGYAFQLSGLDEVNYLGGVNKATMVPIHSISPFFAQPEAMPYIQHGRILKSAASPDYYEIQGGYLYHANNMTVVDCLSNGFKVQDGIPSGFQPVPLALLQAFLYYGRNAHALASCQMPEDVVFFGPGGAERWQITGDNGTYPYTRRRYASTLAMHCERRAAPRQVQISTGGVNHPQQGADIHCPNNTYLRLNQTGQVFQWWDGQLHYIQSQEMLNCLTQNHPEVVIGLDGSTFGAALQGTWASCGFEGKLLRAPNGQVFHILNGQRHYVGNSQIVGCLGVRANAGQPIDVSYDTVNSFGLGSNAYCTYPADIRFVRGDGQPEVWRVFQDGTRQHASGLCYPQTDPRYYVHVVPAGEVDGHGYVGVFEPTASGCAGIA